MTRFRFSADEGDDDEFNMCQCINTDRTYYVAQSGNDTNDGLTPASAFGTIEHAFDVIGGYLVPANVTVTVQLEDGTIEIGATAIPPKIDGNLIVTGDTGDLSAVSVVLDGTTTGFSLNNGSRLTVEGFNISSVAGSSIAFFVSSGRLTLGNVRFGANFGNAITVRETGAVAFNANCNLTASMTRFISGMGQVSIDCVGRVLSLTGSLTFTDFVLLSKGYMRFDGSSFTGSNPTGRKYLVNQSGVLFLNGAVLPGITAGATATQGQAI